MRARSGEFHERLRAGVTHLICGLWLSAVAAQTPQANPARPTVTNPATLPPVGYLQFEQGYLGSVDSPESASEYGINQTTKIAIFSRLMVQLQTQPFAQSRDVGAENSSDSSGDIDLGAQVVLYLPATAPAETSKSPQAAAHHTISKPTVALGYLGRVYPGNTADIDLGGFANGVLLLVSGDVGKLHYDTNYLFNEQTQAGNSATGENVTVRRAQFGQTLSVNHPFFNPNLQLEMELYHFTQPFVHATAGGTFVGRANAVDGLMALSYTLRPNLVLDGGFSHGFTSTSTQWQSFAGFTYLLPYRLWRSKS